MTATAAPGTPSTPEVQDTLVGLIDTMESAQYQQSSPAFQPLSRVDVAVLIGAYVLLPVIFAIVVLV